MFGVGASHLINEWNDLAIDVLGLDWRTSISSATKWVLIKRYRVI